MTRGQKLIKRLFDLLLAIVLLIPVSLLIIVLMLICAVETRSNGLYRHARIGQYGQPFVMYKLRTLKNEPHYLGKLEQSATRSGKWIRAHKLDELPQLYHVLTGEMSFVGPRPDVPGFADKLEGADRVILSVKPGITGPATLKYKHEEQLLALQDNPETYNRTIIWPDKVKINKNYAENWSFYLDLDCLLKSLF
ncbi:sugar transferase [Paucihalobacter ruber]|uniref:Sugar transferase n=1 Tax=Paucihalobacter ruber TaxID=2567861 RepID=A0A506PKW4_9FLAO|nr:sugar transferase [Paucihalobacter ruber]TPV33822.1 sugar transferase [Paucihalobacter ruber]